MGFTGFVREWDRLDRIVKWIALRAPDQNVHLLVIGDGPARFEVEQCAASLGIADRLTFTGVVDRQRVPALCMAFDIALQTALVPYASPLCLFEYLALSKAIVAPDQPNHHEILTDGIDALLYDPLDPSGIEKALDSLTRQLRQFAAKRNWEQFHSPKNLASALSVEAAELLEHFQWLTEEQSLNLDVEAKEAVGQEIADVLLYLLQLADKLGLDVALEAQKKLALNAVKHPAP